MVGAAAGRNLFSRDRSGIVNFPSLRGCRFFSKPPIAVILSRRRRISAKRLVNQSALCAEQRRRGRLRLDSRSRTRHAGRNPHAGDRLREDGRLAQPPLRKQVRCHSRAWLPRGNAGAKGLFMWCWLASTPASADFSLHARNYSPGAVRSEYDDSSPYTPSWQDDGQEFGIYLRHHFPGGAE